jgi:hypothetical protein
MKPGDQEKVGKLLDMLLEVDPTKWVSLDGRPSRFVTEINNTEVYIDVFSIIRVGRHWFPTSGENDRKRSRLWNDLVHHFYKTEHEEASTALDRVLI